MAVSVLRFFFFFVDVVFVIGFHPRACSVYRNAIWMNATGNAPDKYTHTNTVGGNGVPLVHYFGNHHLARTITQRQNELMYLIVMMAHIRARAAFARTPFYFETPQQNVFHHWHERNAARDPVSVNTNQKKNDMNGLSRVTLPFINISTNLRHIIRPSIF